MYFIYRFGSKSCLYPKCQSSQVSGFLNCREGTKLITLADAAIEGTVELLKNIGSNVKLRIFFVLNTDGEASDGVAAAKSFKERFAFIAEAYPNMLPPRTVVMGIGGGHDQGVLGAMSVGEGSYYNFPDAELQGMVDIVPNIIAELSASTSAIKIILQPSGTEYSVNPTEDNNLILSGLEVAEGDTCVILPNGQVFPLELHPIDKTHPSFKELTLRLIKKHTLELIKQIKLFTKETSNKGPMLQLFTKKLTGLKERYRQLCLDNETSALVTAFASDVIVDTRSLDEIIVTQGKDLNWKKQLTNKLKQSLKPKESQPIISEEECATTVVFKVCDSCLECLRLGSKLSTALERDCMELLGSGGYEHFTTKQLNKLCARATKQVNPDSMEDIDEKVDLYMSKTPREVTEDNRAVECWWTGESAQELAESADVPVLVGFFPPGERNRGMSSVNSCLVIDRALTSGHIHVCLQPMSFKTIRGLLCQGKQISRGPDGQPINLIVSFMPDGTSEKSVVLAKMMSSLGASQLVTTNFNSTVGTMEFKNAMLTCLLAITNGHPFSELSCGILTLAVESFYRYNFGIRYLKETLERAANFINGTATTSGDVSTFQLAIADQMLLLAHQRIGKQTSEVMKRVRLNETNNVFAVVCAKPVDHVFWRNLFFRVLRDDMNVCFTAFCDKNDKFADVKRTQKQRDAETFTQILVEGLNCEHMSSEYTFQSQAGCCVVSSAAAVRQSQSNNEKIEFGDYFEETDTTDVVVNQVADENIRLSPTTRDMSFKEIIQHAVELHSTLPPRCLGQPVSVFRLDEIRGHILEKLLARLQPKTDFMIKCYHHIQRQNISTFGKEEGFCVTAAADSLFQILGLSDDKSAWEFILDKLLLAVTYRTNTSYKKDKDDPTTILNLPPSTVLETTLKHYSSKREMEFETVRKEYIFGLKNMYLGRLLQHPKKLDIVPLRICSQLHLRKINYWVLENRGFSIEPSLHPVTLKPTGMAKNTFLFKFSDYFMVRIPGSLACNKVYGDRTRRAKSGFMEHLHTLVPVLYDATTQVVTDKGITRYEKFESLFYDNFKRVDENIPFQLFTSMRISQELDLTPNGNTLDEIKLRSDYPESVHSKLFDFIPDEILWQTSPGEYLTRYFTNDQQRVKLGFEEFVEYLGLVESQVDEISAARLAFDQPILLKSENKNKSLVGLVLEDDSTTTTKSERRNAKRHRRADKK